MAYIYDMDLGFLSQLRDNDLALLHDVIVYDKDSSERWTQQLTSKINYIKYYPNHSYYWYDLAEELQLFGGNTILNTIRGHGVQYREILYDVCEHLKIKTSDSEYISDIENELLIELFNRVMEKSSQEVRNEIYKMIGIKQAEKLSGPAALLALQAAIKCGGFAAYKLAVIIANATAKALGFAMPFAANWIIPKIMAQIVGPLAWILTTAWTAASISGPAFRVTIPSVIIVSYLRKGFLSGQLSKYAPQNLQTKRN